MFQSYTYKPRALYGLYCAAGRLALVLLFGHCSTLAYLGYLAMLLIPWHPPSTSQRHIARDVECGIATKACMARPISMCLSAVQENRKFTIAILVFLLSGSCDLNDYAWKPAGDYVTAMIIFHWRFLSLTFDPASDFSEVIMGPRAHIRPRAQDTKTPSPRHQDPALLWAQAG